MHSYASAARSKRTPEAEPVPQTPKPLFIILMLALTAAVIAAAIVASIRAKKRKAAFLDALALDGWSVTKKPDADAREHAYAPAIPLSFPRAAKGLRTILEGRVAGRPLRVLEHAYTISTGNSSQTIFHLIAATPCPPTWPNLNLRHENLAHKIGALFGKSDIQLDDEAFNKKWRIDTDDETFAILLLTPNVQQWLMQGDARETWTIAGTWLMCARQKRLSEESFKDLAPRPAQLLDLLPKELDLYTPEPPQ